MKTSERNFSMSYFINPVKKDQCVFVTYEGKMTRAEIMAARYEANELLSLKRWNRMVVNIAELWFTPMTLELIDLASDLSSDLPPSTQIALVVRSDQVKDAKLVERVARIEGVFLNYFLDPDKATLWVKQSPGRQTWGETGIHEHHTYEKQKQNTAIPPSSSRLRAG
jgi:hypothetical protein